MSQVSAKVSTVAGTARLLMMLLAFA